MADLQGSLDEALSSLFLPFRCWPDNQGHPVLEARAVGSRHSRLNLLDVRGSWWKEEHCPANRCFNCWRSFHFEREMQMKKPLA